MKRTIVFAMLIAFSMSLCAQEYVTKSDFQAEKQKLTEEINAAKVPGYELKSKFAEMQKCYDSIGLVNQELSLEIKALKTSLKDLDARQSDLTGFVNDNASSTMRKVLTHDIILFGLLLVASIFLIFLWYKRRQGHKLNKAAIDKVNWEFGLHSKGNEEQFVAVDGFIKKSTSDMEIKVKAVQTEVQSQVDVLKEEVLQKMGEEQKRNAEMKAGLEGKWGTLQGALTETQTLLEKGLGELKKGLAGAEQSMQKATEQSMAGEKKLKEELKTLMEKLASLEKMLSDHQQKQHKKE